MKSRPWSNGTNTPRLLRSRAKAAFFGDEVNDAVQPVTQVRVIDMPYGQF
jgi:hypothetical protein